LIAIPNGPLELEFWYGVEIINVLTHGWGKIALAGMTTMGGFDVICDKFDVERLCL